MPFHQTILQQSVSAEERSFGPKDCSAADTIVVKTIRMRLDIFQKWWDSSQFAKDVNVRVSLKENSLNL